MSTPLRYPTTAVKKKHVPKETEENTNPVCSICRSEEFYEDEQGGMICTACGTQSQDYLAEDIDDDDMAVYVGGLGNLISMRNETVKKNKNNAEAKISKLDMIPDTLEALKLYQYVLQMIFDACLIARNLEVDRNHSEQLENDIIYRNTLKSLWMEYLHEWHENKRNHDNLSCSIGYGFTRSMKYKCQCHKHENTCTHPLLPSKPLLLGFIYLTFRIMRSNIIICDIIRWCEHSIIPYINLWEHIPARWKDTLGELKWFFDTPPSEKHSFLSPSLIFYYTSSLSYSLRSVIHNNNNTTSSSSISNDSIMLPTLNSNLIAYKIITQLGLPIVVWYKYIYLTQLYSHQTPIAEVQMYEQYYEEYIMASIIIAIRCCPDWMNWNLHINTNHNNTNSSSSSSSIPIVNNETNPLQRKNLYTLLKQIRKNNIVYTQLSSTKKLDYTFNSAVYTALGGDVDALNKTALDLGSNTPYPLRTQTKLYNNNNPTTILKNKHKNPDIPQYSSSNSNSTTNGTTSGSGSIYTESENYMMHPIAVYPESLVAEELSLSDRRLLQYIKGTEPLSNNNNTKSSGRGKKKNNNSNATTTTCSTSGSNSNSNQYYDPVSQDMSSFIAYTRYKDDKTSIHHIAYLLLLERCASYLYINSQLLHNIVERIETQIVNLGFMGNIGINKKGKIENLTKIHINSIKNTGKKQTKNIKEVGKYYKESNLTLPKLHKQGLKLLIKKSQLYQDRYKKPNNLYINNNITHNSDSEIDRNNINNTNTQIHNTINLEEKIEFSTTNDFMYIEDAYGTAVDILNRYNKHKLITTAISSSCSGRTNKRPRREDTTTTDSSRKRVGMTVLENTIAVLGEYSESGYTTTNTITNTTANPLPSAAAAAGYYDAAGASNSESDAHMPISMDTLRRYSITNAGAATTANTHNGSTSNTLLPTTVSTPLLTSTLRAAMGIHDSDFDNSDSSDSGDDSAAHRTTDDKKDNTCTRLTGTDRDRKLSAAGMAAIARAAAGSRDKGNAPSTTTNSGNIERDGILFTPSASSDSGSSSDSDSSDSDSSNCSSNNKYTMKSKKKTTQSSTQHTTTATTAASTTTSANMDHPAVSLKCPKPSTMSNLAAAIFKK